jgi:broad specificity phosphatase PhoE
MDKLNKIKNIYWIRHAESLSNVSESNYQIVDPGLTSNGFSQCEILKKNLQTNNMIDSIELIVVSPLNRTLENCSKILDKDFFCDNYNTPIISLDEIREHIDQPCHKREKIIKKKKKYKFVNFNYIKNDDDFMYKKLCGCESKSNVISRCTWFIEWLKNRKEKNIMVITHGNFLLPMFSNVLKNIDNKSFFSNCEMRKTII